MSNSKNNYLPFLLLFIQPIFMASNLIVARGGIEFVPPISLAFWRWTVVFCLLLPFTFNSLKKNFKFAKQECTKEYFLLDQWVVVSVGLFHFWLGKQPRLQIWELYIHLLQYL